MLKWAVCWVLVLFQLAHHGWRLTPSVACQSFVVALLACEALGGTRFRISRCMS